MANGDTIGVWGERLSRWGAPVTYVGAVLLISITLITALVRSPDTKANYQDSPESYHRTPLSSLGTPVPYAGLNEDLASADGQRLYFGAGCALCHGLYGAGGPAAPPIWSKDFKGLTGTMREGESGMPTFAPERLSDAQIQKILEYLQEMKKTHPDEPEIKPARPGGAAAGNVAGSGAP